MKTYNNEHGDTCDACEHRQAHLEADFSDRLYCWVCAPQIDEWLAPESDAARAEYIRYKREKYGADWQPSWEEEGPGNALPTDAG